MSLNAVASKFGLTFALDRRGVIRDAGSDHDYTTRPEPEDTLAALRALRD